MCESALGPGLPPESYCRWGGEMSSVACGVRMVQIAGHLAALSMCVIAMCVLKRAREREKEREAPSLAWSAARQLGRGMRHSSATETVVPGPRRSGESGSFLIASTFFAQSQFTFLLTLLDSFRFSFSTLATSQKRFSHNFSTLYHPTPTVSVFLQCDFHTDSTHGFLINCPRVQRALSDSHVN